MGKRANRRKSRWDEGGHWEGFAPMVYTPPPVFPAFHFEGNQGWGTITSLPRLRELIDAHVEGWRCSRKEVVLRLMNARHCPKSGRGIPDFGFYDEYNGRETLGAFLERHDIRWPL